MAINKVAVIGAGLMGSGIAAHLANAGVDVLLLDLQKSFADAGVTRQLKAGGFMDPAFAARITTGSTDDLGLVSDADWIIEAIAERLELKQALYAALDAVRKPGSLVSSNTSTIQIAALTAGQSDSFANDFLITHFFNPPRQMRLLEIVAGPGTRPEAVSIIRDFGDRRLGKDVVLCRDTPGFIANRIGSYWMAAAMNEAIRLGLDVEEADLVLGKPFGIPSTGIFGLLDLVGIDLMPMVLRSLQAAVPKDDAIHDHDAEPGLIARMIAEGRIGRKSGAGFVRLSSDRKSREVTDLATGAYRPQRPARSESLDAAKGDARALMEHSAPGGRFAAFVMERTLFYAASLLPQIADGPDAVDQAMRSGYGWKEGPFELIDRLGASWLITRLAARHLTAPAYLTLAAERGGLYSVIDGRRCCLLPDGSMRPVHRPAGVITLTDLARAKAPVADYGSAALWDLGDGVACLAFRTKMNTFSQDLLVAIDAALDLVEDRFGALVIGSDAAAFSAGADLRIFLETVEKGGPEALGAFIDRGHSTFERIKYAPFPVVGAASGMAFGGGCEILLHCDAIQAHAETSLGLVETRVGVIPGWGGCKEMLIRQSAMASAPHGPVALAMAVFNLIAPARVSGSAFDARNLGFLRATDGITMNRERLLADAKEKALALLPGYAPPEKPQFRLAGRSGAAGLRNLVDGAVIAGRATAHDRVLGYALIDVLTGGADADPLLPLDEQDITDLERKAFIDLLAIPESIARVRHMLATGKPLRN
ncbi:3-hydroxyacyl-CoA dehydrogenase/enoyl-CoA hydratase family protein [Sinirhodobacter populi]|uniref:3-hydroxyacyl-CoA dehydrogenase/enoyl-CoA hydratase family protein n=1 Tax=Paenirhodobacter populi TaxID=2306993 RepID=A0A443K1A8_9RHOB|nr:3-hydroxyacyl-CoA dehydrogenase/enoyl-CoA hydratase family protein [Sinirhodobacter populi]RWR26546.1 3-hydroxyacyl-CoA dehydrogenase/enoyl-CoA hydratase family protein [Sinirhodobacter populi]